MQDAGRRYAPQLVIWPRMEVERGAGGLRADSYLVAPLEPIARLAEVDEEVICSCNFANTLKVDFKISGDPGREGADAGRLRVTMSIL